SSRARRAARVRPRPRPCPRSRSIPAARGRPRSPAPARPAAPPRCRPPRPARFLADGPAGAPSSSRVSYAVCSRLPSPGSGGRASYGTRMAEANGRNPLRWRGIRRVALWFLFLFGLLFIVRDQLGPVLTFTAGLFVLSLGLGFVIAPFVRRR